VISLPREALNYLNIQESTEIEVILDCENRQVILKPVIKILATSGIDAKFTLQVTGFIEQYHPPLKELAI